MIPWAQWRWSHQPSVSFDSQHLGKLSKWPWSVILSGLRLVHWKCFFLGGTFKKHSLALRITILCFVTEAAPNCQTEHSSVRVAAQGNIWLRLLDKLLRPAGLERSYPYSWTVQYETDPAPKRKKILSKRLDEHTVMCQFGLRPEQKKDNFCTSLFYPVTDHMLTEINRRFSKPNCQVMRGIQVLNPTNAAFCDEAALLPFASIYGSNTEDMQHELH